MKLSSALTPEPAMGIGLIRIEIPNTPMSAGRARAWLKGPMRSAHPGVVDDALLCLSEVVTNAHRHTTTLLIRIDTVITARSVLVHVHDDRPALLPRRGAAGPGAERGRGLALVEACADEWGVTLVGGRRPTGKAVWFSVGGRGDEVA